MNLRLVSGRTVGGAGASGGSRWRFVAALGLMGMLASGCAGAMGPEVRPVAPDLPPHASDAYRIEVEALAREARVLARRVSEDGADEVEGCEAGAVDTYDRALYDPTEPLASMMTLVSAEDICNELHVQCFRDCWNVKPPKEWGKKGGDGHYRYCTTKCLNAHRDCLKRAGVLEFSDMPSALDWIKSHSVAIGAAVIVGAVIYVVATDGGGALTLAVLPAAG